MSGPQLCRLDYVKLASTLRSNLSPFDGARRWTCSACKWQHNRRYLQKTTRFDKATIALTCAGNYSQNDHEKSLRRQIHVSDRTITTTCRQHEDSTLGQPIQDSYPTKPYHREAKDKYGIFAALLRGNAERLFSVLETVSRTDINYIRNLPRTTWERCLYLLTRYSGSGSNPLKAYSLHERQLHCIKVNLRIYRGKLNKRIAWIFDIQRQAGFVNTLPEYRTLLRSCAALGHLRLAKALWEDMKSAYVRPDLDCYNFFVNAILYSEDDRRAFMNPVIGVTSEAEQEDILEDESEAESGINPHLTDVKLFSTANLYMIYELFNEMNLKGLQPDLTSYCMLMSALGREGDVGRLCQILHEKWAVNVDAVMNDRDISHWSDDKNGDFSSPLYPKSLLLITVIDTFGQNNQILLALWIVEYISQRYHIRIKGHMWYSILRWMSIQSQIKPEQHLFANEAQLRLDAVQRILSIILAPPYSMKPDIEMYHLVLEANKSLTGNTSGKMRPWALVELMDAGQSHYLRLRNKWSKLNGEATSSRRENALVSSRFANKAKQVRFDMARSEQMLRKWAHFIMHTQIAHAYQDDSDATQELVDWQYRGLPNFLLQYAAFVPSLVEYQLRDAGTVTIKFRP